MAKCKKCGKKGLLLKLDANGLCAECATAVNQQINQMFAEQDAQIAKLDKELAHQDKLLQNVLKAKEAYKADGDIQKAIESFEGAIVKANPPLLNAQSHTTFLIDLYKKSGQNDKAWGLLNDCIMDSAKYDGRTRLPMQKVRMEMAKILKGEKRYSDAVEMYLLAFYHDALSANADSAEYFEERFRKNIKPCVSKLKWDDETVSNLIAIVREARKGNSLAEAERIATEQYRTLLKTMNTE